MPQMPVILDIEVEDDWTHDHELEVFTDNGTGTLESTPILSAPLKAFGVGEAPTTWNQQRWNGLPWNGVAHRKQKKTRWNGWPWNAAPFLWNGLGNFIRVLVYVNQGAGEYKFGARAFDVAGNEQAGSTVEITKFVSGEQPTPLSAFTFVSYDGGSDRISWSVSE